MEERTKTEQNGVITDELRKWAESDALRAGMSLRTAREQALAIADRIDEQHENIIYEYKREYEDFKSYRDIAYVKMPVDADGVPIRAGDEVEFFNGNHDHVKILVLRESGWSVNYLEWDPASLRHHQPDTWERIIDDALTVGWPNDSWTEVASAEIHDSLVERCRRLADGI